MKIFLESLIECISTVTRLKGEIPHLRVTTFLENYGMLAHTDAVYTQLAAFATGLDSASLVEEHYNMPLCPEDTAKILYIVYH